MNYEGQTFKFPQALTHNRDIASSPGGLSRQLGHLCSERFGGARRYGPHKVGNHVKLWCPSCFPTVAGLLYAFGGTRVSQTTIVRRINTYNKGFRAAVSRAGMLCDDGRTRGRPVICRRFLVSPCLFILDIVKTYQCRSYVGHPLNAMLSSPMLDAGGKIPGSSWRG